MNSSGVAGRCKVAVECAARAGGRSPPPGFGLASLARVRRDWGATMDVGSWLRNLGTRTV